MSLRDKVLATLNALCENAGVTEDENGDLRVVLGRAPCWVRVYDEPAAVSVFCSVAVDVPRSRDVDQFVNHRNRAYVLFRTFWENEEIVLRADLMGTPFVPLQLQIALENFEKVADELAPEASAWSRPY
jgi:hypothetical protein